MRAARRTDAENPRANPYAIPEGNRIQATGEGESWKKTARVYCTVTYNGSYSVDSETVTVIFSTCDHMGQYSPKGECQRCGYQLDVNYYDWIYKGCKHIGAVTSAVSKGGKGYTFPENATVDLQGHTVGSFSVQQFQNTTITNGTITNLNFPDSDKNVGSVTLAGITVTGTASIGQGTTVTVGENCVFQQKADIYGETKLTGGTFEKGIAYSEGNVQHLLGILADGYAYFEKDDQGNDQICEYFRADSENVSVKPHKCEFSFGECVCGRVCQHTDVGEYGVCKNCGMMAQPFAIGETRYATLKDAIGAARDGDTGTKGIRMITALDGATKASLTGAGLAGFTLEEYGTVVAKKSILGDKDLILETGKHNFAYKKGVSDPVFGDAGNLTQYTNVLVGFSLEDCKEELVMRPYILLRDENGDMRTVYGGTVTRSIGYIAKQNENTYRPGTDGYYYIHEIIAAVYGQG